GGGRGRGDQEEVQSHPHRGELAGSGRSGVPRPADCAVDGDQRMRLTWGKQSCLRAGFPAGLGRPRLQGAEGRHDCRLASRHRQNGGYALLVVLFFGAVLAMTLYLSLPRAALEAQRAKEDDLIYRGSQYARAVQLYYRKFKKYPGSMEDLEKSQNV